MERKAGQRKSKTQNRLEYGRDIYAKNNVAHPEEDNFGAGAADMDNDVVFESWKQVANLQHRNTYFIIL